MAGNTLMINCDIDTVGIRKSLKNMFAGVATVIREAAQNAQRAKATHFWIDHDEKTKTLTLSNDGLVMKELDWQRLFRPGKSGWDAKTSEEQNPFGIGCASMIFCTTKMKVESGYAVADIDSASFYDGSDVDVKTQDDYVNGTIFTLTITDESWSHLGVKESEISKTFAGFVLPVFNNGREVHRPKAQEQAEMLSFPFKYGNLIISNDLRLLSANEYAWHNRVEMYVQGLPVSIRDDDKKTRLRFMAAHLDSKSLELSSPDRMYINNLPEDFTTEIDSAIQKGCRYLLERDAEKRGWMTTMHKYATLVARCMPEMFMRDDAPVLGSSFFTFDQELRRVGDGEEFVSEFVGTTGSASAVYPVKSLEEGYVIYTGDHNVHPIGMCVQWFNFAHDFELPVLYEDELPSTGHTAIEKGFYPYSQDDDDWKVEVVNGSAPVRANFYHWCGDIVFFDSMTVTPPPVTLNNGNTVQWGSGTYDSTQSFCIGSTYYVGRKCNFFDAFVSQIDDYAADENIHWYTRDCEREAETLAMVERVIKGLRGDGLDNMLESIITSRSKELDVLAESLKGKSFTLSFDDDVKPSIMELSQ